MLNKEEIEKLIKEKNIIEGYIDLNTQLTPNGFDLTAANIFSFNDKGRIDFSNKERSFPECEEINPVKLSKEEKFGWWDLKKGIYKVKTNETLNLPRDLIAFAFTRTSLLRMGAFTQHGVWGAGFCGKSEFVLVVDNFNGVSIKQNARVAQLVFERITETKTGYQGIHQNKK